MTDRAGHGVLLWPLLVLLFLIAPLYGQPSIGGAGLALTYNIPVWAVASWVIAAGLLLMVVNRQLIYPRQYFFVLAFPLVVIAGSLLTEINQPTTWLFRQLYIYCGLLFLFALFQFRPRPPVTDRILFILVIAAGVHALFGVMQVVAPEYLPSWFLPRHDDVPRGVFRQINVQASFLATGCVVALYSISRPSFSSSPLLAKLLLLTSLALSSYIVVASGSRVGLLSAILGLLLLLVSRRKQLFRHKIMLLLVAIVITSSTYLGQAGLARTVDKTARMTEASYSSARLSMYRIGLELTVKRPIQGHGIGSFLRVWNQQAADFKRRHPEAVLPPYVTHPHNELLFWAIEGGAAALLGILLFFIGLLVALYRCGVQRGGAYAAMLLPISLHTQVELPFYISSVHWFVWLFLLFLPLNHSTRVAHLSLSLAATRLVQVVALVIGIGTTWFMVSCARAQGDIYGYLSGKNSSPPYLEIALGNLYFNPLAEQLAMRSMLYAGIEDNDREGVQTYVDWAEQKIRIRPELEMYQGLILADAFLQPPGRGCGAITRALEMYAHNEALQSARADCHEMGWVSADTPDRSVTE